MLSRILTHGWYIRTPVLHERERTSPAVFKHLSQMDRLVELVQQDTAVPLGHLYEETLADTLFGSQRIRLVKVTRPYNKDFLTSAHVATFLFPCQGAQRIVTPLDGTEVTWLRYLIVNQRILDTLVQFYSKRLTNPFLVLLGTNVSPYTQYSEYLETQSVKVAHMHLYLLSDSALASYEPFTTSHDFRSILNRYGHYPSDIRKDFRRFFPTILMKTFVTVAAPYMLAQIPRSIHYEIADKSSETSYSQRYPFAALEFRGKGTHILATLDTLHLVRGLYGALDSFYRKFLMEAFTSNYSEVIHHPDLLMDNSNGPSPN